MKKRQLFYILLLCLSGIIVNSCRKKAPLDAVLQKLDIVYPTINADGVSIDTIKVIINPDASLDRQNVIVTATAGTLIGGSDGKLKVAATFINKELTAVAVLKAPSSAGQIDIKASPEITTQNGDYFKTGSINAINVEAAYISIKPSGFGISGNFSSTDTLTGTLKSISGGPASSGVSVKFEAKLKDWSPANARFSAPVVSSDANSQVKSVLGVASGYSIGTNIYVIATITTGNAIGKADTTIVTINQ